MDYGKLALKRIEELTLELNSLANYQKAEKTKVSLRFSRVAGVTELKRTLRFNTVSSGDLHISFSFVNTRAVTLAFVLDGETVKQITTSSGIYTAEAYCSGVAAGYHECTVTLANATSFTVTNAYFSAEGVIGAADKDYFTEAFPDGQTVIRKDISALEIYRNSAAEPIIEGTVNGIVYARALQAGTKKLVAAITETGCACIIDVTAADYKFLPVCGGATAVCGYFAGGNDCRIFVTENNYVKYYAVDLQTGEALFCGSVLAGAGELSVYAGDDGIILITGRSGYITVQKNIPTLEFLSGDTFNVTFNLGEN